MRTLVAFGPDYWSGLSFIQAKLGARLASLGLRGLLT